jgi:hypothetical protein
MGGFTTDGGGEGRGVAIAYYTGSINIIGIRSTKNFKVKNAV